MKVTIIVDMVSLKVTIIVDMVSLKLTIIVDMVSLMKVTIIYDMVKMSSLVNSKYVLVLFHSVVKAYNLVILIESI